MSDDRVIAVLGIGNMGRHYVSRLLAAGYSVLAWNRTPDRVLQSLDLGAQRAASVPEALERASIVICALEHGVAVEATILSPDSLAVATKAHLLINTTTMSPALATKVALVLKQRGANYVDAPVSGGTRGAAAGTLTLFVGGDDEHVARADSILRILGTPHHVGPIGAGQIAKLVNQVIVAGTIGAVAEGLVLAERAGLNPALVLESMRGGFAESRILREHGDRMVRRDFVAGAANRVFLKDLREIDALASEHNLCLPLASEVRRGYQELVDGGRAEEDHSSYWRLVMHEEEL